MVGWGAERLRADSKMCMKTALAERALSDSALGRWQPTPRRGSPTG